MTYIPTFKAINFFFRNPFNLMFILNALQLLGPKTVFTSLRGKDEPIKEKVPTTY